MIPSSPEIPVDVNWLVSVQTDLPALPSLSRAFQVSKKPNCQAIREQVCFRPNFWQQQVFLHSGNIRDGDLLPSSWPCKINYCCACSVKGKHAARPVVDQPLNQTDTTNIFTELLV